MHFPLDILTDYLNDQGVEMVKEPAHPKNTFDWVTSVADFLQAPVGQTIVPLFDDISRSASVTPKIVTIKSLSDASVAEALAPDDILIRTSLPIALLADRIQRFLFSIIQWNDRMAEMVDDNCISLELLKESESMIGAYIGLSDSTFSYIAHTPDIQPVDEVSRYFIENGNYPTQAIRHTRDMGLMRRWENQDWTMVHNKPNDIIPYPTINRVVKRHGAYAAHILLVSPTHIDASTRFLFDLLAAKLEICLRRHWRKENPLEQRYSYFLHEVLKGTTYTNDRLPERAELHNIPYEGAFQVCVAGGVWKVGSASYLAKRAVEIEPRCKVVIEEDDVVMVLCAEKGCEDELDQMEENLFRMARTLNIEIGVSERVDQLELISLGLDQARIALKYGSMYSTRYLPFSEEEDDLTRTVLRFRKYFPYCATDQFENNSKFISRHLSLGNPLVNLQVADAKRGSNDFQILRTYLYCNGQVSRVCHTLHMHRNTVLYRLEKIRALIALDLDESDVQQYLRTLFFLI